MGHSRLQFVASPAAQFSPQHQGGNAALDSNPGRVPGRHPGDVVSFANSDYYLKINPGGAWSNENTIYLGKDAQGVPKFSGLGADDKTEQQVKDELVKNLESNPRAVSDFIDKLAREEPAVK